jgi:hypothetical protein
MPGRALPETAKRRLIVQDEDQRAHQAAKVYAAQFQDGSNREHVGGKLKSLRKVAEEFGVHHSKVYRLYKGGMTIAERNRSRGLLSIDEEIILANDLELSAQRGKPFSHAEIEEAVNHMLMLKYGPNFQSCGKNWVDRFLDRHRDTLKTHWGCGVDSVRTNAANPQSIDKWFGEVLGPNIEGVEAHNIHGMDETGCPPEASCTLRVVGSRSIGRQVLKRASNRQTITVFVCISAAGCWTRPHIIIKGSAFCSSWTRNNITEAT